jgi:hypothetical protein
MLLARCARWCALFKASLERFEPPQPWAGKCIFANGTVQNFATLLSPRSTTTIVGIAAIGQSRSTFAGGTVVLIDYQVWYTSNPLRSRF